LTPTYTATTDKETLTSLLEGL